MSHTVDHNLMPHRLLVLLLLVFSSRNLTIAVMRKSKVDLIITAVGLIGRLRLSYTSNPSKAGTNRTSKITYSRDHS